MCPSLPDTYVPFRGAGDSLVEEGISGSAFRLPEIPSSEIFCALIAAANQWTFFREGIFREGIFREGIFPFEKNARYVTEYLIHVAPH